MAIGCLARPQAGTLWGGMLLPAFRHYVGSTPWFLRHRTNVPSGVLRAQHCLVCEGRARSSSSGKLHPIITSLANVPPNLQQSRRVGAPLNFGT